MSETKYLSTVSLLKKDERKIAVGHQPQFNISQDIEIYHILVNFFPSLSKLTTVHLFFAVRENQNIFFVVLR